MTLVHETTGLFQNPSHYIYDHATSLVWQLAVYDAVHNGLRLSNIGGQQALDVVVTQALQRRATYITELCCGTGDGCRYLAERLDATITGVEINASQFEVARASLATPGLRGEIELHLADILEWQPSRPQDLTFALDSLMLVADLDRALCRARSGLHPGGRLILYDVVAGPAIDEETRRYAREEDGILNLVTPSAYLEKLDALGFDELDYADATQAGVRCFEIIHCALLTHQAQIVEATSTQTFADWRQLSERYSECFATGKLGYGRVMATRAAD